MLFGTTETFAIEAMTEPELVAPSAVWGRLQIWCEGCPIGDYTDPYCGLYSSYCGFKEIVSELSTLWREEFNGLSDMDLWNLLDGLLYGYHGDVELEDDNRSLEKCQCDARVYSRFDFLTNWGEQFDRGGKSFIFYAPEGEVRILNRTYPSGLSRQASLENVFFAINAFLE
jgi:hypothetical protein